MIKHWRTTSIRLMTWFERNILTCLTFFLILFTPKSVFSEPEGWCFPREDAYVDLVSKEPNASCLFVANSPSCIWPLGLHIRNYCSEVLVHKGMELHNFDEYLSGHLWKDVRASVDLEDIPQNIGDTWEEIFYYKDNPSEKIVLSFEVKETNKLLDSLWEILDGISEHLNNFWPLILFLI